MPEPKEWTPAESDLDSIFATCPEPLEALSRGEVPAVIFREAYPRQACRRLIARLIDRQLLYDPAGPVPEKLLREAIPEGYYREGIQRGAETTDVGSATSRKRRIDIGTSLGYRGSDPVGFFAHAAETRRLFEHLFDGLPDPVELIYRRLSDLAPGKRAVTAHESDGRTYGPAIVRAHYGSYTYKPHFDSVRLREKRDSYSVYRFDHQFAGVLVLQNSEAGGETAQCIIHRCLWREDIQPHLDAGTFHRFAADHSIESCRVVLDPGDLYFFNTRAIHEVPGVDGDDPRVVMATFIGYSSDENDIFVWS